MPPEDASSGSVPVDWDDEPVPNLARFDTYEEAREQFPWDIPDTFNIATDIVTKHADRRGRVALYQNIEGGPGRTPTAYPSGAEPFPVGHVHTP